MLIEKRSFAKYVLLNCLTLGIYGFIVASQINKEVNALCKGDKEEPRFSYVGAWAIQKFLPIIAAIAGALIGAVIGFVLCLIAGIVLVGFFSLAGSAAGIAFGSLLVSGLLFGALSGALICAVASALLGTVYYNYWWYKQASRLHLNANRYGIEVREKGTDIFLFRTIFQVLLSPLTVLLIIGAWLVPVLILGLLTLTKSVVLIIIFAILFAVVYSLFGMELMGGSVLSTYFIIKNLNRYADVYRRGATPFDPMGYEYYPSLQNKYPNFIPGLLTGNTSIGTDKDDNAENNGDDGITGVLNKAGCLVGLNGTCAGYTFDLNSGEEIIIGKDAKVSSVVIDPAYKEISRKHVGVCYDIIRDQYRVVDYSSNGTWANGTRLVAGQEVYLPRGTELKLANDKNTFRLG